MAIWLIGLYGYTPLLLYCYKVKNINGKWIKKYDCKSF